jgi:class 3 adenylate cyclase/tetratricopeptide (TPR) repeat protein
LATLVFCDLVGSTALAERVDAESVSEILRLYFVEMGAALERHGGVVEKFIGDAVVGVFGVPDAHEDDSLRACRAALEMQARVAGLNEEFEQRFGTSVAVRIGVNSGEVIASRETLVTGDAANVAARLEQAAGPGEVYVGEATYRLVRDAVEVESVEPMVAKGKSEPLRAYRLLEVAPLGPVPRRQGTLFVGRSGELALLDDEFASMVSERQARLVTVVGEAGVGKSRLAAEFVDRVGSRARVARGGCLSYGEGITYWPVAQIVRELAGLRDDHTAEEARSRVPPRIAQLLGLAEGNMTAEQVVDAVAELVERAAFTEPFVAVVDDIHWAEPALLDLLERLPRLVDAPVLVLCLARPELREHRPSWSVTLDVEPLGSSEVDALLESLDAAPAARSRIARTAAGNPLYTEELVAWARDGGDLDALPTSLNALLSARLDRLDPGARDALVRGAIEGELFHEGAVVELSDMQARLAVPDELVGLTRKDLIRLTAGTLVAGEVAYRFKHILVREAAYRATSKKLRATLHERFADWLECLAGDRIGEYHEILGYHLEQAYRYRTELGSLDDETRVLGERAAGNLAPAGLRAATRGDLPAAVNLLERALALGIADPRERARVEGELSYPLFETGRGAEAEALLEEGIETATGLGDRGLAARLRVQLSLQRWRSDSAVEMERLAEQAIETFRELGDQSGLANAERLLGLSVSRQGRHIEGLAAGERALVYADAAGDQVARRRNVRSIGAGLWLGPTPVAHGIRRCEELREAYRDDRVLEAVLTRSLSLLYAMAGRSEDALQSVRASSRVLDALQDRTQFPGAAALELAGDRAGAEREWTARWLRLRDCAANAPDPDAIMAATELARFYCDEGRWDEAADLLPYGGGIDVMPTRQVVRARLAAHDGEHDEALELIGQVVEQVEQREEVLNLRADVQVALAEVQRAAGNFSEADAAIAKALALYDEKGNVAAADRLRAGLVSS